MSDKPVDKLPEPEPPKPLSPDDITKIVNDRIDLRDKYLDFVQKQMEGDRKFLQFLVASVVVVFGVFSLFGYKSMKDMREDIKESTKLSADRQLEETVAKSKATLQSFTDQTAKDVTERIDAELQKPQLQATISTEVKKFTRASIAELSSEQVREALESSPQIRIVSATLSAQSDQRRSFDELLRLRYDQHLTEDARQLAKDGVSQLVTLYAPDTSNLIGIAYTPRCQPYTELFRGMCRDGCNEEAFTKIRQALAHQSKDSRVCTMNFMIGSGMFPPELRAAVWQRLREDQSLEVTMKAIQILNFLVTRQRFQTKPDAPTLKPFNYDDLPVIIKFLDANQAKLQSY